jgi:hypothetical protein
VGHCQRGPGHTVRPQDRADATRNSAGSPRASAEAQPRCGVTLGGVKRRVKDTRASSEAGTRRRQVRWYPTHGSQPDQPSRLTGSASSHARRGKKQHEPLKNLLTTLDIGSHSRRQASGAGKSQSEARAAAVSRRLQALVGRRFGYRISPCRPERAPPVRDLHGAVPGEYPSRAPLVCSLI